MDVNSIANYDVPIYTPAQPTVAASPDPIQTEAAPTQETSEKTSAAPVKATNGAGEKDKPAAKPESEEAVQKTIEQINKAISSFNREMRISVHAKTQRLMIKVMDTTENKVIREIPPEKVLDAFAKTLELAGILVDKKS